MRIDPVDLSGGRRYHLMCSCIIPRPIAWVGTLNADGSHNLAPFSFFNGVSSTPPLIALGFAPHDDKPAKDTLVNIERTGELCISVPTVALADKVAQTGQDVSYGVDEFELAGLTPLPGERVSAPRVAEAPVQLECRLWELKPLGDAGSVLVLAQIVLLHFPDTMLSEWGVVDSHRFDALARLGGISYAGLDRFDVQGGAG